MNGIVSGIAHTAFNVKDMDKSVSFYEEVFDFKKAFALNNPNDNKPWIVYMYVGKDQFLELFYDAKNEIPYNDANIGFSHICLAVDDI